MNASKLHEKRKLLTDCRRLPISYSFAAAPFVRISLFRTHVKKTPYMQTALFRRLSIQSVSDDQLFPR